MPDRIEAVTNCKIRQAARLALVAHRTPIDEREHYRRLETPLIFIFQQLAAEEDMAHLPCTACPGRKGPAHDNGQITVWTFQTKDPKPLIDCASENCENKLPSTMITL